MSVVDLVFHIGETPQPAHKATARAPKKTNGPLTGRGGSSSRSGGKRKQEAQGEGSRHGADTVSGVIPPGEPKQATRPEKEGTTAKKQKLQSLKTIMVIGIDPGMSGSGLSCALVNTDPTHVTAETRWPMAPGISVKVPSEVALYEDNIDHEDFDDISINYFGFEIPESAISISHYKVSMDADAKRSIFDDPVLENEASLKLIPIANGVKNNKAMVVALRTLLQIIRKKIEVELPTNALDSIKFVYVISYPAACSQKGIEILSDAVKDAGFGDRQLDRVEYVSEAHASALYGFAASKVQYGMKLWDESFKKGSFVTVLDMGALTVDLATMEVLENDPELKLREATIASGGKCGTAAIHCRLLRILEQRYGDAFFELPNEQVQRASKFFKECENVLKRFDGKRLNRTHRLPLAMRLTADHDGYNAETREVLLKAQDIKDAIDGSLEYTKALLLDQRDQLRDLLDRPEAEKVFLTVLLCGGGSLIPYVFKSLKKFCEEHSFTLIQARDPESSVSRGAVISQLNQTFLGSRKSRASFGIKVQDKGEDFLKYWLLKGTDIDTTKEVDIIKIPGHIFLSTTDVVNREKTFRFGIYMFAGTGANPEKPTDPGVERVSSIMIRPENISTYLRNKLRKQMNDGNTTMTFMPVTISLAVDRSGRLYFEAKHGQASLGKGFLRFDATENGPAR